MNTKRRIARVLSLLLALGTLVGASLPASAAEMSFTTLIEAKYEEADQFSEGLAAVKQNGKWGYIDESGKTVIPFQYDIAYPFSEGLAIVGKLGKYEGYGPTGEKDEWGYDVMEEGVHDIYYWYIVDTAGKETQMTTPEYVSDPNSEYGGYYQNVPGLYGFRVKAEAMSYSPIFHNGYLDMQGFTDAGMDGFMSLIYDRQGQRLDLEAGTHYLITGTFNEGVFVAYQAGEPGAALFNEEGDIVMELNDRYHGEYNDIRPFNQGLAPVWSYDKWGFMNRNGDIVIQPAYVNLYVDRINAVYEVFNDGIASVQLPDGKWGGINKSGATVIPFAYENLLPFSEGLAPAQKNGKWGVIDTANNVVVPFQYDALSGYNDGVCVAVQGEKAFCIDRYGKQIAGSDTVDSSQYFTQNENGISTVAPNDIIVVEENGKYGYMTMDYTADLPQKSEMDGWAYEEVVAAIEADLVPQYLQNQYKTNITRADFAALAVELITTETGKTAEELVQEATGKTLAQLVATYPFVDANGEDILVANALGIINGKGNGIFDPYGQLTRQDAATMLMRVGKYLGKTDVEESDKTFADGAAIAGYAQEAVEYVNALGVMNGTSSTTFSPKGTYTRQQAYITSYRLFEALQ